MSLANDLRRARKRFDSDTNKKLRATCEQVSSDVIQRTPVGNPDYWAKSSLPAPAGYIGGTLRNSWRATINTVSIEVPQMPDESASAARSSVNVAVASLEAGKTFVMANNQPYAQRVEDGYSQQQPAGMMKVTLSEAATKAGMIFR